MAKAKKKQKLAKKATRVAAKKKAKASSKPTGKRKVAKSEQPQEADSSLLFALAELGRAVLHVGERIESVLGDIDGTLVDLVSAVRENTEMIAHIEEGRVTDVAVDDVEEDEEEVTPEDVAEEKGE